MDSSKHPRLIKTNLIHSVLISRCQMDSPSYLSKRWIRLSSSCFHHNHLWMLDLHSRLLSKVFPKIRPNLQALSEIKLTKKVEWIPLSRTLRKTRQWKAWYSLGRSPSKRMSVVLVTQQIHWGRCRTRLIPIMHFRRNYLEICRPKSSQIVTIEWTVQRKGVAR